MAPTRDDLRRCNESWEDLIARRLYETLTPAADPADLMDRLTEVGPLWACKTQGHPDRPRPRRRYREQPWRCSRCKSWWVTVYVIEVDGWWAWQYVGSDQVDLTSRKQEWDN